MDRDSVIAAIEGLPGVDAADIGSYNTGTPGDHGVLVSVTVDDAGYESLGDVVGGSVRAVADSPGDYSAYSVEVTAPDPEGSDELVILTLSRYQDKIGLPVGTYVGSGLIFTPEELRQIGRGD
ncbi:hypothetical protein ET475_15305 [Microbacterium protaetiae]|uniref:Uncharacterized protein n=1 Tax=Microbacterium protaetiae TaxID=2509458 RepID=A0A4V0YDM3_9MICO|nr:hypothetical protein [Microbacterium protaetiae]QAY61211.1 hypothetical protein ET475_15305 [Microbacterium protaetiae]